MIIVIYVDTSKDVGDVDHLKVFANEDAAERWFAEHDPEAGRCRIRIPGDRRRLK